MKLLEVNSPQYIKLFHEVQNLLYKHDRAWIKPMFDDIEGVFSESKNKYFRHGEAIRWVLVDSNNKPLGRIAAFYDKKSCGKNDQPTGGIGFFECINDQKAAFTLFETGKKWLQNKGMEAMDGPVNFGDRDRWWGLLVDGFQSPNYCMPYNPLYYKELFEEYGFQDYFQQYTYHRYVFDGDIDHKLKVASERILANKKYTIRHINKKKLPQHAEEFRAVYNNAWAGHSGVKEISKAHAMALLKGIKPIMDERLMWFAYYENKPVGFLIMIPEMNQVFKHLNGKMNLCGKIKFLWYFKVLRSCDKALGLIFGFVEEHRQKGLNGAMVHAFKDVAIKKGFPYREIELNWIGDFNPTMMRLVEMVGFKVCKTHITYRYLFNRDLPFERAKKIN